MSWIHRVLGKDGSSQLEVDSSFFAARTRVMPLPYGTLGHYRVTHHCVLLTAQAANSRLFELRVTGTNPIVLTRLVIKLGQFAAGTPFDNSLDVFRATSFTAVDTTGTVTPTSIAKKTSMAAAPGGVAVRGVTVAGATAGMTAGTLTKDASPIFQMPCIPGTAASFTMQVADVFDDINGTHPFVLGQNEGIEIENRVLNATSFGVHAYFDCSYAEMTAF